LFGIILSGNKNIKTDFFARWEKLDGASILLDNKTLPVFKVGQTFQTF
jgi:hypothetical protein